jgi:hypothetical protein
MIIFYSYFTEGIIFLWDNMSKVMRVHLQKVIFISVDTALADKLQHKFLVPAFFPHDNLAESCD